MAYTAHMIPRELQRLRRRAGLTQQALAARLGVCRDTISRWERGMRRISRMAAHLIRLVTRRHP